ncbi:carboxypeptidase-like regulatory domain-containing protein [Brumimicrobium mesophilum]|uniref:carboxypeptidase-like regulatory domain-containing protein n=1 Tax=Brumimicrobium mesophilum TaxID=392717 RepID=UPI00131D9E61|nr:carboxypeptidase-like regulatory domain-containing protein [Brumimicrobium mesophilum]
MKNLKTILFLIFFLVLHIALGQNSNNSFKIKAILIDSLSDQPISFASIYKTRDTKGTLSNYNGEFTLENVTNGDTIICSFVGYEKLIFIAQQTKKYSKIYLLPEAQLEDEVTILADDAFLYQLVSNAKKSNTTAKKVAKTYFELESFHNNAQLELFQGYYNGTFKGYDVSELEMKNARFALAPIENRFFISTETSKAMYMQNLMESDAYFPTGPLELSSRKLRKTYWLSLNTKFKNEENKIIYAIKFKPKVSKNHFFQGTVWIDSLSNKLIKIKFNIENARTHPFQAIWSIHSLEKVNLELSKSFIEIEGEMFLNSMDFNYNLAYKSENDSLINISTRAILYAYNFSDEFILPFFDFAEVSNADYRKIQMLPDNQKFWACTNEFKIENNSIKRNSFINEKAKIKDYNFFDTDTLFKKNFFEQSYAVWNGNRFLLKEKIDETKQNDFHRRKIPSNLYHLEVQLFMDLNILCDTLQIITKTVFDPFDTFYNLPMTKESQAFINIYFDLMEIERRKMHEELLLCGNDLNLIKKKYKNSKIKALEMSEIYFKEMQRGTNRENLLKWNEVVKRELNIDNFTLFEVGMD